MQKKLAVVICNYNKKEYVLKCIHSVMEQTFQDFDVVVVDNASTDGSSQAIRQEFGTCECLEILENAENLGGSGGFNTGVRYVLAKGYPYVMLVDNDIYMDKNNIANLVAYLDSHNEVGMAGSKIYKMDSPDEIQDFGAMIDFANLGVVPCYAGEKDHASMPSVMHCDYVPACSLMTRAELIKEIGMMPEDNFIYWDDMEWGWKYNLAGHKVVAVAEAKVWHKGGATVSPNTFQAYYMYRNKINFFTRYYPKEQMEQYIEKILEEVFRASYACYYSGRTNRGMTIMDAFLDALDERRGKADDFKIRVADQVPNALENILKGKADITLLSNEPEETLVEIKRKIAAYNPSAIIKDARMQEEVEKSSFVIQVCNHIFEIDTTVFQNPYMDKHGNVISNTQDFEKCRCFKTMFSYFKTCFRERLEFHFARYH